MTISDYNSLRRAIFDEASKLPEVAAALDVSDVVYIYDVTDAKQQHGVLVLTARSQLNAAVLADNGFDPETSDANLAIKLNRKTKCTIL